MGSRIRNVGLSWKVQIAPAFLVVVILGLGGYALQATGQRSSIRDLPDTNPAAKEPWYKPIAEPYIISDFDRWDREQERDTKIWVDLLRANSAAASSRSGW